MPTVWIPALLRRMTNDQESVQVPGQTLREVIANLDAKFPGIQARLCDGDDVRLGLAVVINDQVVRGGLSEVVKDGSEIHFIAGIAGGTLR
jgi:molybdopterin converting factor small subunit